MPSVTAKNTRQVSVESMHTHPHAQSTLFPLPSLFVHEHRWEEGGGGGGGGGREGGERSRERRVN